MPQTQLKKTIKKINAMTLLVLMGVYGQAMAHQGAIVSERAMLATLATQNQTAPNQAVSPQMTNGQATLTTLPVQVPNQLNLPPMHAIASSTNTAKSNVANVANPPTTSQAVANQPQLAVNAQSAQTQPAIDSKSLVLNSPVIDEVGILSPIQINELSTKLQKIYGDGLAQPAIVIVPSTGGVPIFDYAMQVASRWGLGREQINDGLLIVVATNDRNLFIATGYGLEGALPDARLSRIINKTITPTFKSGNYAQGLMAGLDEIETRLREEKANPSTAKADQTSEQPSPIPLLIIGWIAGSFLVQMFGRLIGSGVVAVGFFTVAMMVGVSLWLSVLGTILLFFMSFFLTNRMRFGGGGFSSGGHSNRGGFGGGFDNTPTYRGGGGNFGGGGAGGSW